jgi:heme/copper-type cytochrome/quinol oxidase subunit 2
MKRVRSLVLLAAIAAVMQTASPAVQACAACFGKSDSNMAQGMNMGIFALLLVITSVLCGVAGFFVYVARRAAQLENSAAAALPSNLSEPQTNA